MSADRAALKSEIKSFIVSTFLPGEEVENLADDTPLKPTGIIDSLTTIQLVAHVESRYGIRIEPHEAAQEFDTIDDIAALVARKMG